MKGTLFHKCAFSSQITQPPLSREPPGHPGREQRQLLELSKVQLLFGRLPDDGTDKLQPGLSWVYC
jgi:hypothetical protein